MTVLTRTNPSDHDDRTYQAADPATGRITAQLYIDHPTWVALGHPHSINLDTTLKVTTAEA
jgi:hypothetical protein